MWSHQMKMMGPQYPNFRMRVKEKAKKTTQMVRYETNHLFYFYLFFGLNHKEILKREIQKLKNIEEHCVKVH